MKTGAVIVAAGLSSRMKEFKPMLSLGDTSLIKRVISTMKSVGAGPIVVVTGYNADMLEKHISRMGVICVRNKRYAETQMFDSIALGLYHLKDLCDRVLIMPADVPQVSVRSVQMLLERQYTQLACPMFDHQEGHPLLISTQLIPSLLDYKGDGGLRKAIDSLGLEIQYVVVDDEGVLLDADTPQDYANLLRRESELDATGRLRFILQLRLAKEEVFFGPGIAKFLELVEQTGSMQTACKRMHLSYSKGWKMVNLVEHQLGFPVLTRKVGGIDGGGSQFTECGREFVSKYLRFQLEAKRAADELFRQYFTNN